MVCRHKGIRYDAWKKIILWCRRHNKPFAHHDVRVHSSRLRYFQLRGDLAHAGYEDARHISVRGTKLYCLPDKIDPWTENV